jgi:DNA mismatch repair protein MutS2
MTMDATRPVASHALEVVEFGEVLELVAREAVSEVGAELIRDARPDSDANSVRDELVRVEAARAFLRDHGLWAVRSIPDIRPPLRRLSVAESTLDGGEMLAIAGVLAAARITRRQLGGESASSIGRALLPLIGPLPDGASVETDIAAALDDQGSVKDSASAELRRLRRELTGHREKLVGLLERIAGTLEPHQRGVDSSVTVRDGRYVLAIRREARATVGGIVHDTSTTGATLFVEPPAAVEFGNRIRELQARERGEVERILLELTEKLRPLRASLGAALEALACIDSLFARARFAERFGCAPAGVCDPADGFYIAEGRHPLLVAQGGTTVPFALLLDPGENTLVISGPNAGGKTVLLKSVALFSAMVQAGVPAPLGAGSRIAVFDRFFADVGDEQSIESSLSTFSAHLRNLADVLASATARSLVLLDEVGSGTDPVEGAALAAAILSELTRRGTTTIATTHLSSLQQLAATNAGVVNASLQFDGVRLEPTYQFIKGIPGRSYGLSMARRMGLPAALLDDAAARLPESERNAAELIETLKRAESDMAERQRRLALDERDVIARAQRTAERETKLAERTREFEQLSRRDARRHLLDARAEVERTIRELRARADDSLESAATAARRRVEELAASQDRRLRELAGAMPSGSGPAPAGGTATALVAGDHVTIASLGGRAGTVIDIRGEEAVVAMGAVKITVGSRDLTKTAAVVAGREKVALRGQLPDEHVSGEIDIRGMRADDVDEVLIPAIDAAARADLRIFRIIHGKGTGALRERVHEVLARDTRVIGFRPGAWNEGGSGVTVAEIA